MDDPQAQPARFSVVPSADSHFSWLRTRLSTELTFMSWLRTSVALVGFGFTIFHFFQRFPTGTDAAPGRPMASWILGLLLVAAGTVGLAIAI